MQRSAPRARHARSASSAWGGPIVIAITSPPFRSFSFAACATAAASKGLSRRGTPSRLSCFVSWSNSIESARGTCLTRQTIFTCGSLTRRAGCPVRHPRQRGRPRSSAERRARRRCRRVLARRRLRVVVALAARDDRAVARAPEHDLDPRQRRALAPRAAGGPARSQARAYRARLRSRHGGGLALFVAGAGRGGGGAVRSRLTALRRRELSGGAGRGRRADAERCPRQDGRL